MMLFLILVYMTDELFFTEQINPSSKTARFDAFESKHIAKTLRRQQGDTIAFTDGKGKAYQGTILTTKPVVQAAYTCTADQTPLNKSCTALAVGFIRHTRMDVLIEKCTELGIGKFFLVFTKYSNYYTENTAHWQKVTRQAIKQSIRYTLPEINICKNLSDFIQKTKMFKYKFIAEQNSETRLSTLKTDHSSGILFIIGPEGGFDESERQLAYAAGFKPVSFGACRLRTETAAIVAVAYINLVSDIL
jgi:16S rRNA (uracil1498-N3)-methyltransferase